jgi:NADH dehydrogenase (ubiquinone) 1 alpha subcomplex subunit 13
MLTRMYSELAREKMWARIHLIPMLQAEEDRDLVRRHLADQAREKELLGENFKVYNSDRYVEILVETSVIVNSIDHHLL